MSRFRAASIIILFALCAVAFSSHQEICSAEISIADSDVLYTNIENTITIQVAGYDAGDIMVYAKNGKLSKSEKPFQYKLVTLSPLKKIELEVAVRTENSIKKVGSKSFRVRNLPNPTAHLGALANDGKPKSLVVVKMQERIITNFGSGLAFNIQSQVTQFDATLFTNDTILNYNNQGDRLRPELKNAIEKLMPGDYLAISNIQAIGITKPAFTAFVKDSVMFSPTPIFMQVR